MAIFFYKVFNRNLEIGNTRYEFFPISGEWGKLGIPNLARMSLVKRYNAAKCQGYSLYRFLVIKGKPQRGKVTSPLPNPD